MVTKSTNTVGLIITDITNPFFAQLARGVEEITWPSGYMLILANTDEDVQHENAILQTLHEKRVDGLIVVPASSRPNPAFQRLVQQGIPVVLLDRAIQGLEVDVILVDNVGGAEQAVSYLIELGHSRIGMILDNLDILTNSERRAGYEAALRKHGLPVEEGLIRSCQYSQQSAYVIARELLCSQNPPSALFTANNFMTLGALKAIQELKIHIPEDISLIGFDELEWNQLNGLQLTTVAQPVTEMGQMAAQRLIARLKGAKTSPIEVRLKTKFIIRQSCGPAPATALASGTASA
jgi:LacI family transcriptional regulator